MIANQGKRFAGRATDTVEELGEREEVLIDGASTLVVEAKKNRHIYIYI